jgi:hypothetical protein
MKTFTRTIGFLLLASTQLLHSQAPPESLEGHDYKWTDNEGENYKGLISKGVGMAIIDTEQKGGYFVVHLAMTNFTTKPIFVDVTSFRVLKGDFVFEPTHDSNTTWASNLNSKTLNPYQNVIGYLYFAMPTFLDQTNLQLVYKFREFGLKFSRVPLVAEPW